LGKEFGGDFSRRPASKLRNGSANVDFSSWYFLKTGTSPVSELFTFVPIEFRNCSLTYLLYPHNATGLFWY
jgi:hypothetical protein